MKFIAIGEAANNVVRAVSGKRDLSKIATAMAMILLNDNVDLGDEREVEAHIRKYHRFDLFNEVDRLVEMCPDIAREIQAANAKETRQL